ncbi:hypothetical protein H2203_005776 [Taxawa tesnikishii (nom. ined.)]|nr:hypothetical protein H2203_005776 [Dothideales sp. JES 119]
MDGTNSQQPAPKDDDGLPDYEAVNLLAEMDELQLTPEAEARYRADAEMELQNAQGGVDWASVQACNNEFYKRRVARQEAQRRDSPLQGVLQGRNFLQYVADEVARQRGVSSGGSVPATSTTASVRSASPAPPAGAAIVSSAPPARNTAAEAQPIPAPATAQHAAERREPDQAHNQQQEAWATEWPEEDSATKAKRAAMRAKLGLPASAPPPAPTPSPPTPKPPPNPSCLKPIPGLNSQPRPPTTEDPDAEAEVKYQAFLAEAIRRSEADFAEAKRRSTLDDEEYEKQLQKVVQESKESSEPWWRRFEPGDFR